jgi:thiol-disulfide isomerase/thioredoxin
MNSRAKLVVAALTCALIAGAGIVWRMQSSDDAPATTEAAEAPGRAVIYPDGAEGKADVAAALIQAAREKKRVLLDFGGNWCGDCQVLEIYFHDAANRDLLEANYVLVPVNIGRYDTNLDLAARYGVPLEKGGAGTRRTRCPGQAALQPAQLRIRLHAPYGLCLGDRIPAEMEGVTSGGFPGGLLFASLQRTPFPAVNSSWPCTGVHVPSMAWRVLSKNSGSPWWLPSRTMCLA